MVPIVCLTFKIVSNISFFLMILLTVIPIIHVYVNRINHKLVFEIKNGYKLELQTPESRKLFSSIKELIDKIKK